MRKLFSGLLTLGLVLALVLGMGFVVKENRAREAREVGLAAYVPPVVCRNKQISGRDTVRIYHGHYVVVRVTQGYRSCKNKLGPDFVRPTSWRISMDRDGSSMRCFGGHWYSRTGLWRGTFKFYFSDPTGRNFSPRGVFVPCSETTFSQRFGRFGTRSTKPLYPIVGAQAPRVRVSVKLDFRPTVPDKYGDIKMFMQP